MGSHHSTGSKSLAFSAAALWTLPRVVESFLGPLLASRVGTRYGRQLPFALVAAGLLTGNGYLPVSWLAGLCCVTSFAVFFAMAGRVRRRPGGHAPR